MATYTDVDLTAIKLLIAMGAGRVTIAGKSVEYRSLKELRDIQSLIEADLNTTANRKRVRTFRFYGEKGL